MDIGFALAVVVENFINWPMRDPVVLVVGIPSMASPGGGSTRGD